MEADSLIYMNTITHQTQTDFGNPAIAKLTAECTPLY